jgi:hypothetical protein
MTEKKQRIMVEKNQRSRRTRARAYSPVSLDDTEDSDETGLLDVIASTLFCVGSFESHPDEPSKMRVEVKAVEEKRGNIWSCQDVGSIFTCGRLPCQHVSILDSPSVDDSELTLPHVLANMAADYDRDNSTKVQSMMGESLYQTEGYREFISMAEPRSSVRTLKSLMGNRSGLSVSSVDSRKSKGSRRIKGARVGTDEGKSGYKPDGGVTKKPMDKGRGVLLAPTVGGKLRPPSLSRRKRSDFATLYEI